MSDFMKDNENKNRQEDLNQISPAESNEEFSTIFSAPVEKKPAKAQNVTKKRIASVIAAVLAVAVLIGGSVAIVKLIPKKEEEEQTSSSLNVISVLELDSNLLDKVTVTNQNGTFVFTSTQKTETNDQGEEVVSAEWAADVKKKDNISADKIADLVSNLNDVSATREITSKSAEDCGLLTPSRQIDIESEKDGNFSVLIGADSPDNAGTYLKLSTKDNIYLVDTSLCTEFDFALLDLAKAESFEAITVTDDMSDYTDDSGTLVSFDTLTISGKNFSEPVVFVKNTAEFISDFVPFKISSPVNHDADNLTEIMSLFTSGLTTSGAYSLEITEAELEKVGLNNPDMVITVSIAGVSKTYKFAVVDDEYCAVIDDQSTLIQKVSRGNLPFVDYKMENFYSEWVFLRSIDNLNSIVYEVGGNKHIFDISYTEEDDSKIYTILYNGKKITASDFQDFYTEFVGLRASDFDIETTDVAPEMTVTANFKSGKTEVVTFTRTSATKYQYALDGDIKGRITSSAYNKVYNYLKGLVADK